MKLSDLYWYRITPLHFLLWPISVLYGFLLTLKKLCYWLDILPSVKLPVTVIMIDSISVEDGSKMPLLLWLVDCLTTQGYQPGIITHDNSDTSDLPREITSESDPHSIDGKTLLLAHHCPAFCPVWVGKDRIATAHALLNAHPECNVIICNGDMQYYRLERDIEIITVDFSEHSFGNGLSVPAGPLRINLNQLKKSDILVTNGKPDHYPDMSKWGKTYTMQLTDEMVYNVLKPEIQQSISHFKNKQLHIVTDADNSRWCLDLMQNKGLHAKLHSYAENHRFSQHEINLPEADVILMPEENALQCRKFAHDKLWALPRKAWINSELLEVLIKKLENKN
ncbi:MAG: tetraacyldisaccharide 4'-kinase [Nitrosomonas sp.]|nr:tetraacyldisaccharide 4'-kinase [Nitrosomonas sp.]